MKARIMLALPALGLLALVLPAQHAMAQTATVVMRTSTIPAAWSSTRVARFTWPKPATAARGPARCCAKWSAAKAPGAQ